MSLNCTLQNAYNSKCCYVYFTTREKDIIKKITRQATVPTSICKGYTDNGFDSEYIFYMFWKQVRKDRKPNRKKEGKHLNEFFNGE